MLFLGPTHASHPTPVPTLYWPFPARLRVNGGSLDNRVDRSQFERWFLGIRYAINNHESTTVKEQHMSYTRIGRNHLRNF